MAEHQVDKHVGKRLRQKRLELGISQPQLADKVGRTFQQIQKYESGQNRVGASMLFELCKVMEVTVEYFFEELEYEMSPVLENIPTDYEVTIDPVLDQDIVEAAEYFMTLKPAIRKSFIHFLVNVSADEAVDEAETALPAEAKVA